MGDLKGSETAGGGLKGTGEDTGLKLKGSDDGDEPRLKTTDDAKPKGKGKKEEVIVIED